MKNINKQEDLVSALWNFAKGLQKSESIKSGTCVKSVDVKGDGFETKMDMEVMHEAIEKIAEIFNLEIQEVQ
jgi:hypothetical protein